jgi:hypothetical protein
VQKKASHRSDFEMPAAESLLRQGNGGGCVWCIWSLAAVTVACDGIRFNILLDCQSC